MSRLRQRNATCTEFVTYGFFSSSDQRFGCPAYGAVDILVANGQGTA